VARDFTFAGLTDARLHLDLGALLGPFAASATNVLEGAWFGLCLVGALLLARR
jgi:hypothetical protein